MPGTCQLFYRDMLSDMKRCMNLPLHESQKVETCFWIAYDYWNEIKLKLKGVHFASKGQEVEFFRVIKPKFTQFMEFYIILTEALMFIPAQREAALLYWQEERKRVQRFYSKNRNFIEYYQKGRQDQDHLYFIRSDREAPASSISMIYDYDKNFCTSHDGMVRSFLAHRRYDKFLEDRIAKLIEKGK